MSLNIARIIIIKIKYLFKHVNKTCNYHPLEFGAVKREIAKLAKLSHASFIKNVNGVNGLQYFFT